MTILPIHGPNRFQLGIFAANADGGLTVTKVPECWTAAWPEIVHAAQLADRAGIEFFLPIARWKGFEGETNARRWPTTPRWTT
jgi:FMNH2-dependent dimethyl sulfone monooxygenase